MIVALADTMKLEVIAEGVETLGQCEVLAEIGCQRYQGFLFAKPMPADQIPGALMDHSLQKGFSDFGQLG